MRTSVAAAILSAALAFAQDEARQIFDSYFSKGRTTGTGPAPAVKPDYRVATPPKKTTTTKKSGGSALGVTVWRMESSAPNDGARLLVQGAQVTPHRIEADEPLRRGDRVRLSIESPSDGYLYVVDQELRSGGVLGSPYLIFPTMQAHGGDNRVRGGRLLEIPAQTDQFPVFTVEPKGQGVEGERLTLILAPAPIPELKTQASAQQLPKATFDALLAQYKSDYQRLEMVGGNGQARTKAEQQAGDGSRLLTQGDPAPQSIFYFQDASSKPVVASIRLRVR